MMKEWFTAADLARRALPGLPASKRGVNKLAVREAWAERRDAAGAPLARPTPSQGLAYNIALLPEAARHALAAAALRTAHGTRAAAAPIGDGHSLLDARLAVLAAQRAHAAAAGLSLRASDEPFAALYALGRIAVPDWVRAEVASVSGKTLRRWRSWERDGLDRLAARQGRRKDDATSLLWTANDGAIAELVGGAIARQPHLTAAHVRALIRATFGDEILDADGSPVALPQERAVRRFIAEFKDRNRLALTRLTDPDRFKSAFRFAGLTRNGDVERLNQRWQVDASPADVLTTDGRYAVYVLVDIWSRRVIGLVTRTPRAAAVLLLIRKAILAWGVPEEVVTDNGSDFVAREVKRAFAALAIRHSMCDPFAPEQKGIVERAIGTLQRDLMPLLPGFVGHSVADRKAIEARRSFAARLGESADKAFCVELTAAELQGYLDRWAAGAYAQSPHAGLPERMTPFARAASFAGRVRRIADERALDVLLAPVPGGDGMRIVGKQGVKIDGGYFLAATLMPGEKVLVRHDPSDMGRVMCFSEDGSRYLAEAVCPERAGIDPAEAVARARAEQARILKEQVEPIRRAAKRIKPRDMVEAILGQAERDANVIAFPHAAEAHTTPALEAAGEAAQPKEMRPRGKLSEDARRVYDEMLAEIEAGTPAGATADAGAVDAERAAFIAAFEAEQETARQADRAPAFTPSARAARVVDLPETAKQRFRRAYLLETALAAGGTPATEDLLWLGRYQACPEYAGQKVTFEEFGVDWLMA